MRFLWAFILLLVGADLHAQDTTFIKVIHAPGNDRCQAMIQSLNSDFILCGSTSSFNNLETDAHVIRLDEDLNILWSKHFGQPFSVEQGNDLVEDSDGNIYVSGLTNATGYDALLLKIDPDGNLIWSKSFGSDDWDFINAMAVDSQGNLFLAGSTYAQAALDSQGWLFKVNSEGDLLWERYFGADGSDEFTDLDLEGDDFIYLSGNFENTSEGGSGSWMLKCDSEGELVWERFGGSWRERALDICFVDGKCFFNGYREDDDFGLSVLNYRLDTQGNLLASDYFLNEGNNYFEEAEKVNEELLVSCGRQNAGGNGGYDFLFNSQSWQGSFNEARTTGGLEDDICTDVVVAMSGTYYFSGYTESFDAVFEDIMITYSTVNVPPDGSVVVIEEVDDDLITHVPLIDNKQFVPYPNPCVDELRFLGLSPGTFTLEVFRISGERQGSFLSDGHEPFVLQALEDGAYLFILTENGRQIASGQLLKASTSP